MKKPISKVEVEREKMGLRDPLWTLLPTTEGKSLDEILKDKPRGPTSSTYIWTPTEGWRVIDEVPRRKEPNG